MVAPLPAAAHAAPPAARNTTRVAAMFGYVRCCLIARMPASVPGRARTRRGSPLTVGGRRKGGDPDRLSDRLERRRLRWQLSMVRGNLGCLLDRRSAPSSIQAYANPRARPG